MPPQKWIHLFRNGIDRFSSGDVDGWHYQIDARSNESGKWGGFACPKDSLAGIRIPHEHRDLESARYALNCALRERGEAVSYEGATNMTVAQLIEVLKRMPQDAPIITHANNHSTGLGTNNDQRVALRRLGWTQAVIIGNWSEYNMRGWQRDSIPSEVWTVRTWGPRAGLLTRGAIKRRPPARPELGYQDDWEFTDESK